MGVARVPEDKGFISELARAFLAICSPQPGKLVAQAGCRLSLCAGVSCCALTGPFLLSEVPTLLLLLL